ncbi:50S ribosomal protein L22 [Candidatus Nanosalina sp. VS9-1]|uniref:50S ribosomal protein L22 n=1 Tax=Candidatus Nanosalina sp. VS9-1 TaxID=3388566 RepID=UPI0039DFB5FD
MTEAKAVGKNLPISWKDCTEIGRFIDGDSVEKAENKLERVIEKELHVPYTKFDSDAGHKSGGEAGGYPVKASEEMLKLLRSAKSNGVDQGLQESAMKVSNVITNQGPEVATPSRHRGRTSKSAHVKIFVSE